jgi:hypothetical protein
MEVQTHAAPLALWGVFAQEDQWNATTYLHRRTGMRSGCASVSGTRWSRAVTIISSPFNSGRATSPKALTRIPEGQLSDPELVITIFGAEYPGEISLCVSREA